VGVLRIVTERRPLRRVVRVLAVVSGLSLALAGAVVISGFIALTVSPMMAARLLTTGGGRFQRFVDHTFETIGNWYGRRLTGSLSLRPITLLIVVALIGTTVFMFEKTSTELAPDEDQGAAFAVVNAPPYATIDYTQKYLDAISERIKDVPEIDARFSIAGISAANSAFSGLVLKPWEQRKRSQAQIQQELQTRLNGVAGVQAFVFGIPSLPGTGGGLPISFVIQSTNDASRVYAYAEDIKKKAQASGKFIVVQDSISFETPQVEVLVDRQRAAALGVSVADIGNTLTLLVGENSVAKFDRDSRAYDIIPQVPQADRFNPESLQKFFVRNQSGTMLPLSSVVTLKTVASAPAIEQFNQLNSATLTALPVPGVTTGQGLQELQELTKQVLPAGYFVQYAGQSRTEIAAGNTLLIAFGLAIIVIYLVLAAQFESFRDPFVIMMAVPLSMFGALVPLNLGLTTINIYTQVGLITLVGLITKHGILMVQFANELRETSGVDRRTAIIQAAQIRLRPILMTTAAMVLGVLPLILSTGAGAKARFSMGLVIAAGMAVGTIFTLFVVPMFYTLVSARNRPQRRNEATHAPVLPPTE